MVGVGPHVGAQIVAEAHEGVKLVLVQGDLIFFQEVVELDGKFIDHLFQQFGCFAFGDTVGVKGSAVACGRVFVLIDGGCIASGAVTEGVLLLEWLSEYDWKLI